MFEIIKINLGSGNKKIENFKEWLSNKGHIGTLLLGVLFALAFCPYSGVLFFGMLIPLVLSSTESLLLPPLFALGTGLPVILFAFLLAFSVEKVGKAYNIMGKIEKIMRYGVATIFLLTGLYYLQYLIKYFMVILF